MKAFDDPAERTSEELAAFVHEGVRLLREHGAPEATRSGTTLAEIDREAAEVSRSAVGEAMRWHRTIKLYSAVVALLAAHAFIPFRRDQVQVDACLRLQGDPR